jgi:hypothetical protein
MAFVVRIILTKTNLLCLVVVKMSRVKSQVLSTLFGPVDRLKVCWMAKGILLELFAVDTVYHLWLLLGPTKHGGKLLAVVTEVVLHGVHILLELERFDGGSEINLGFEKFIGRYFVLLFEI